MVRITEELIRRRAEHNEGQISTLQEVTLHQFEIEKIELVQKVCKHLKILYLQNNIINKIENVGRLKELEYLNLALNNVAVIENLEGCESLEKLDLTCNFVEDLISVENLKGNFNLKEIYLTGNPCTKYDGYRDFVITALPQLERLDGVAIEKSERLEARQKFTSIRAALVEKQKQLVKVPEKNTDSKDVDESQYTRESRTKMYQELAKKREEGKGEFSDEKEKKKDPAPDAKKVDVIRQDGRIMQCNEGEWGFKWSESDDGTALLLDISFSRFLDTSLIDVDVQPTYIVVVAKKKKLVLAMSDEVCPDKCSAQRSQTTGHLVITMPKLDPDIPSMYAKLKSSDAIETPPANPTPPKSEVELLSGEPESTTIDYTNIIGSTKPPIVPDSVTEKVDEDSDFEDDPDVPPLI